MTQNHPIQPPHRTNVRPARDSGTADQAAKTTHAGTPITRTCRWCSASFVPAWKGQGFCSNACHAHFNGWDTDPDRSHADDDSDSR
jgi:hypothetical protein